jgi:NTE family protein
VLLAKTSNKNITPVSAYQQIDSVRISRLDIQGLKRVSTNYVSGTFDIEPGQAVAVQELEEAISMLYGSSYFSYATYNLIEDPEKPGSYVAVVRLTESPYDLDIGVSLHHDPDFKTGILLNFYTRNFLAKGSRLNFDAAFSEHPRFRLLYEVDRGHKPGFGISSDLYFIKPTLYNDRGNSEGTYNYTSSTTALYALVTNKNHRILKLGGEYTGAVLDFKNVPALRNILDPEENNPTATKLNFNLINIFTELDYDSRDDFDFPRKGHKVYLGARYHTEFDGYLEELFQKNYVTARLRYAGALSPTSWLTFLPQLDAGVSMLDYSEFPFAFNIGGLGRNYFGYQLTMPGYHYMQVAGASNYAGTQLEVRFSPFKNHYASVLGGWGAFTSAVGPIDLQNLQYGQLAGIGVKYGLDTFIGPIEITAHKDLVYGYGWLAYFNFGYWF